MIIHAGGGAGKKSVEKRSFDKSVTMPKMGTTPYLYTLQNPILIH